MRMCPGFLIFLALIVAIPETSTEFHAKYGKPDVERFVVRSDLTLAVEYGSDGQACRMRIETRHHLGHGPTSDAGAQMDEVQSVLDEVVPEEVRGKTIGPGNRIWNSCHGALPPTEYENVTVVPIYKACQTPLIDRGVDVLFKRGACKMLPKYSERGSSGDAFPITSENTPSQQ
jgi:hypothetical protein